MASKPETTPWQPGDIALWETNDGDQMRVVIGAGEAPPRMVEVSPEADPSDAWFVKTTELEPANAG